MSPVDPALDHKYNDDLLAHPDDQATVRMLFPDIYHVLDHPELRAEFATYNGLANRAKFDEDLGMALARARRTQGAVAVLCLDIDGLKLVNDRLGHAAGDALIAETATRQVPVSIPEQVPVTYNRCVARQVARQVAVQTCTMVPVAVPRCLTCP